MKENKKRNSSTLRFRHFSNRSYAVFSSLHRPVSIGVMAVSMLTFANVETVSAQTENHAAEKTFELGEVEVSGSRVPMTVSQAARTVTVLDRKLIEAAPVQSVNDLLKYAAGVDVRQRGGLGMQTDISVRGGTFDQITILLNGINICDPQTGHNAAEFPVTLNEIERIEILEGPAGRVYGTSSLVGAINIVTRIPDRHEATVSVEDGSYGYAQGEAQANWSGKDFKHQISGGYMRSDGYSRNKEGKLNADGQRYKFLYQGQYQHETLKLRWHAGGSTKDYGANTFYGVGSDDQFEHVTKYYAAVQAEAQAGILHFKPSVYWNRSEDRFEYFRDRADKSPFNYHRTDVYGLHLNHYIRTILGKTAFGGEFRNEGIISSTLGEPLQHPKHIHGKDVDYVNGLNRTHLSFHLEHYFTLGPVALSAGVVAAKNTGNEMDFRFYPGADISVQLARHWKAYASYNTSLRMPTFTELYYKVGGHQADKNLKPEEMRSFEIGTKYHAPIVQGSVNFYYNRGSNMIDWIRDASLGEDSPWVSVNHTKIHTYGVEASARIDFEKIFQQRKWISSLQFSYNYMDQDKKATANIQSKYALEYLRHKFVAQVAIPLWKGVGMNLAYRWQDRVGNYMKGDVLTEYAPYAVFDAKLHWTHKQSKLYVEANNLFDKKYYDYGNIPQPGFWMKAGWSFTFAAK